MWTHRTSKDEKYFYCKKVLVQLIYAASFTVLVSSYYVLVFMCPHATIYVSTYCYICVLVSSYYVLVYMCPHATIYVSTHFYVSSSIEVLVEQVRRTPDVCSMLSLPAYVYVCTYVCIYVVYMYII